MARYRCEGGPLDDQWHEALGSRLVVWPGGPVYRLTWDEDRTLVFVLEPADDQQDQHDDEYDGENAS
jgi:hypothetical protein